jgi:hypothetical protein
MKIIQPVHQTGWDVWLAKESPIFYQFPVFSITFVHIRRLVTGTFLATLCVARNRGADFVQCLVPARPALRNKALDPTALLGASGCKHPASPAMLAGQRRE